MKNELLEAIQGKKIKLLNLSLLYVNERVELSVKACCDNTMLYMLFYNVSCFSANKLSKPLEIKGFEIVSNKAKGWEKDLNYTVHDFEDYCISFFCEDFEMLPA